MQPMGGGSQRLPEQMIGSGWDDMQRALQGSFRASGLTSDSASALANAVNVVMALWVIALVACMFFPVLRKYLPTVAKAPFRFVWLLARAIWTILRYCGGLLLVVLRYTRTFIFGGAAARHRPHP